jgi:outer membrane protein
MKKTEKCLRKKGLLWIAVLVMGLASSDLFAFKIAVFDMQKALTSVEMGKKARTSLQKERKSKLDQMGKREKEIKSDLENFRKQSSVLSDDVKQQRQAKLQQRIMKFQQEMAQTEAMLRKKEQDLTQPIIQKIQKVVSDYGKKQKFDIVLEKNETGVLYSASSVTDVTQKVIQLFDEKH